MLKVATWVAISAGIVVALLFALLLVMVTRPAVLAGVSGDRLAHSIHGDDSAFNCEKRDDGRWLCRSTKRPAHPLVVDVDWTGCWKIEPERDLLDDPMSEGPGETAAKGCIELGDVITTESLSD